MLLVFRKITPEIAGRWMNLSFVILITDSLGNNVYPSPMPGLILVLWLRHVLRIRPIPTLWLWTRWFCSRPWCWDWFGRCCTGVFWLWYMFWTWPLPTFWLRVLPWRLCSRLRRCRRSSTFKNLIQP